MSGSAYGRLWRASIHPDTFAADSTVITREISGGQIAGVSVTLQESGTSVNALTLYGVSGDGVTYNSNTNSVTIGDFTYAITSTSADNYSARASADQYNQTSGEIVVTPTTYSFTAAGQEYTVAIEDGVIKSYDSSTNSYGSEVSVIPVTGNITYTLGFSTSGTSGTFTVEESMNGTQLNSSETTIEATSVTYFNINGTQVDVSEFIEGEDGSQTFTTTYGGSTYHYTLGTDGTSASYYTTSEAIVYEIATDEDGEAVTTLVDGEGNVLSGDYVATYTTTVNGATETVTLTGSASEIAASLSSAGIDSATLTTEGQNETIAASGTASYSYVTNESTQATATIVDNQATLSGVTLIFETGEDGQTYTTVSINGAATAIEDNAFTAEGELTTLASLVDGVWSLTADVDNVTNTTDEPLVFQAADGDQGTLTAGASYTPETNELTNGGQSVVKNEDGYAINAGEVTGLNEDGSVYFDENGALVVAGANGETKIGDTVLAVTGDDDFTIAADANGATMSGVSDGAQVSLNSDVPAVIQTDGEGTINLVGDGQATIDGTPVTVSGDPDGITATFADDSLSGLGGVSDGAQVSVAGDVPVQTDAIADSLAATVNGTAATVSGADDDGVTFSGNDLGSVADGATVAADGVNVLPEENASEVTLADGFNGSVAGSGVSVANDADGVKAQVSDGELSGISGISDGAQVDAADVPMTLDPGEVAATLDGDAYAVTTPSDSEGAVVDTDGNVTLPANSAVGTLPEDASIQAEGTVSLPAGSFNVNGSEVAVAGDEDGFTVTPTDDGVAVGGIDAGANVSVPSGTPVSTNGSGTVGVNGTPIVVSGDDDGVTITPNEDGTLGLSGLDNGALVSSTEDATLAIGDETYAIGENASVKASADGVSAYTAADKSFDDELSDLGIDSTVPVHRISDSTATVDADGNNVYDLSEAEPGVFRLDEAADGEPYSVILPEDGGSTAIIPSDYDGEISVTGSDHGDRFINLGTNAAASMKGGEGNDYYKTASPKDTVDLSEGGKDTVDVSDGGSIVGYDPFEADGPALLVSDDPTQADLLAAIEAGTPELTDNGIGSDIAFVESNEDGNTYARLMTEDGASNLFGWTGEDGGSLSSADRSEPMVLVGNAAGDHAASTIDGSGSQADTLVAGASDVAVAGNGDQIDLVDNASGTQDGAAIDAENSSGTVEINGFKGGFNRGSHSFRGGKPSGFSFLDGALRFIMGGLTAVLNGRSSAAYLEKFDEEDVALTATASSDTTTVDTTNPGSGVLEFRTIDGDDTVNNVAIATDKTYYVSDAETEISFLGESSGSGQTVDFANVEDDVLVDLSGTVEDNYEFTNISAVKGGAGDTSLVGASNGSVDLYAGTGKTTLNGGLGNTKMYGNSEGDEAVFTFVSGNGRDTIESFDFGAGDTNDKVDFSNTALSAATVASDGSVRVTVDGGDVLTIKDGKNSIIKAEAAAQNWDGRAVEFGDDLTYDAGVGMYGNVAETGNKLTVNETTAGGEIAIYMNGKDEYGKAYDENYYYNVNVLDASGMTSNASLAGGDYEDDTITGGSGSNSLWGGLGGNDSLVGGSGQNEFFYLVGDGEDTISGAKSGDVVNLLNVSINDIDLAGTYENSTANGIEVKFNDGGSLKVNGSNLTEVSFKVSDGTEWKIQNDRTWKSQDDE